MNNLSHFVHVIESPGSIDLLDGRTEGRSLCAFLDLAEIPNTYCLATDTETFNLAITERMVKAVQKHSAFPIIHISAHGNEDEIALTNNDRIAWNKLGPFFQTINTQMNHNLLVCFSSCYGTSATKTAIYANTLPMALLIGCEGEVNWHQAVIAYVTFYNHFLKIGSDLKKAVEAMNIACGRSDFKNYNVDKLFTIVQNLRKMKPSQLEELMETLKRTQLDTETDQNANLRNR